MTDYIYALKCPLSGEVRYIGKSNDPERRLYLHVFSSARRYRDDDSARWIRVFLSQSLSPILQVLLRVPDDEDWRDHERRIIQEHIDQGCKLTNLTAGGEGVAGLAEAIEQKRQDSMRASWTEERRAKQSAKQKAGWADPEIRRRRIAGLKANAATQERRAQLSAASRSRSADDIQRLQDGSKAYWSKPENRKAKNEQTSAKMIAGQAKMMLDKQWANPAAREAQATRMRAEMAAGGKISEAIKTYWDKPGNREAAAERMRAQNSKYFSDPANRKAVADRSRKQMLNGQAKIMLEAKRAKLTAR